VLAGRWCWQALNILTTLIKRALTNIDTAGESSEFFTLLDFLANFDI